MYPFSSWKARRWHGTFLGCLRGLSLPHVQAQHGGSLPHRCRPKWQHEPGQWGRVASVPQGLSHLKQALPLTINILLLAQLFTVFIKHLIVFIIFQYIRWAALTHIATTLGLAFRRSICVNTVDIWQWLELQDKWVRIWEFKRWLTRFTHSIKTNNAKMVTFVQLLLYCSKMLGW